MPFTLAHPAAVLPLTRCRLVPSALVAGAVAPDVVFYLPRSLQGALPGTPVTHSVAGWWTVDLILGVLLVVLWRVLLRRPVLDLLPEPWGPAAVRQTAGPVLDRRGPAAALRSSSLLVGSVLLGTATHLLLDLLTHDPGLARGPAPAWLEATVLGHPVYDLLQWGLSAVGLALLAGAGLRWAARTAPGRPWPPRRARPVLTLLMVAGVAGGAVCLVTSDPAGTPAGTVTAVLVGAVGWGSMVLVGYALAWWAAAARRDRQPDGVTRRRPAEPATSPVARPPSRTAG